LYINHPGNRQDFVVAPRSSYADEYKVTSTAICAAIRSAVAPTTPNPSVFGMPLRKQGSVVWIEGEWDRVDARRCLREYFPDTTAEIRRRVHIASFQEDGFRDGDRVRHLFDWNGNSLQPTSDWNWLQRELKAVDNLSLLILKRLWDLVPSIPLLPHVGFLGQFASHASRLAAQLDCQIVAFP